MKVKNLPGPVSKPPVKQTPRHHAGVLVGDDGPVRHGTALDVPAALDELRDAVAAPVVYKYLSIAHFPLSAHPFLSFLSLPLSDTFEFFRPLLWFLLLFFPLRSILCVKWGELR